MGVVWVFNEVEREHVAMPCTRRRHARRLPLWLHRKLRERVREKRLACEDEHDMLNVKES